MRQEERKTVLESKKKMEGRERERKKERTKIS